MNTSRFRMIRQFAFLLGFGLVSLTSQADVQKALPGLNVEDFEKQQDSQLSWGNNPFVTSLTDVSVSDMILYGIVFKEGDSSALINAQVVRVGDRIGASEILEILHDRVILKNENGVFSLNFGGVAN